MNGENMVGQDPVGYVLPVESVDPLASELRDGILTPRRTQLADFNGLGIDASGLPVRYTKRPRKRRIRPV